MGASEFDLVGWSETILCEVQKRPRPAVGMVSSGLEMEGRRGVDLQHGGRASGCEMACEDGREVVCLRCATECRPTGAAICNGATMRGSAEARWAANTPTSVGEGTTGIDA